MHHYNNLKSEGKEKCVFYIMTINIMDYMYFTCCGDLVFSLFISIFCVIRLWSINLSIYLSISPPSSAILKVAWLG